MFDETYPGKFPKVIDCRESNNVWPFHRFAELDFSALDAYADHYGVEWWHKCLNPTRVRARLFRFRQWLALRPEKSIAIVGHCNCLMALVRTRHRIPNAVPLRLTLRVNKKTGCAEFRHSWWFKPGVF